MSQRGQSIPSKLNKVFEKISVPNDMKMYNNRTLRVASSFMDVNIIKLCKIVFLLRRINL